MRLAVQSLHICVDISRENSLIIAPHAGLSTSGSHRLKKVYSIDGAVIKMSESREAVEARYLELYPRGTPLIVACENGNLDDVEVLLTDDNKNAFGTNSYGYEYTPLMVAANFEHFQVVEYLIGEGADPNIVDSDGVNALHKAAISNRRSTEVIELLLNHMSLDSINKKEDRYGDTPLDKAYGNGPSPLRQAITALIRSAGGKANYYDANGEFVGKGNGDLNTTDNNNNNNNNNSGKRKKGENDGGSSKKMKQMDLLEAAKRGDSDTVKELLKNGANINQESNDGVTPLHTAAYWGRAETCKLLLEKGANINAKDKYEWTPLHVAAKRGHTETCKLLLEKGADIDAKDSSGQTPLYEAAFGGHTKTCKLLLDAGADPLGTGEDGNSVLWHAFNLAVNDDIVKLLVDNMDVNQVNQAASDGETPLHLAVKHGSIDIVKMLIAKGANVNAQDNSNRAALEFALSNSYYNFEKVTLLLDAGADKNQLPDVMRNKLEQLLNSRKQVPEKRKQDTCPICLGLLSSDKENGPAIRTACGHIFHTECLKQAIMNGENLKPNAVCPVCRAPILIGVDDMSIAIGTFRLSCLKF